MKKSANVLLSAFFIATTSSCMLRREYVDGADEAHNVRDTVVSDIHYRYYRGGWFRVHHNNCMRVPYYMAHSNNPNVAVSHHIRSGGFGKRASDGAVAHG